VLAVGVNQVLASRCSLAHAELLAIGIAQQSLGGPDLGRLVPGGCTLVSSAEPCAMCLGAIPWAGINRLVCGARDEDVRAIGFDEGDKPKEWARALERRGIAVIRDCLRREAAAVIRDYPDAGGIIYGPRREKRG
jgi:tRNA(Arg) A34 adenosine deaminase TadA